MQISAINVNSFRGTTQARKPEFDQLENVDFNRIAGAIDKGDTSKKSSPVKFFVISSVLALASFATVRGAAYRIMKNIDGKFPVFGMFTKVGKYINNHIKAFNKAHPISKVKTTKEYFINAAKKLGQNFIEYGKKGINAADKKLFKGHLGDLYAANATKRIAATTVGAGSAAMVIASRYSDVNGNGIPDKIESGLSTAKELAAAIPALSEISFV